MTFSPPKKDSLGSDPFAPCRCFPLPPEQPEEKSASSLASLNAPFLYFSFSSLHFYTWSLLDEDPSFICLPNEGDSSGGVLAIMADVPVNRTRIVPIMAGRKSLSVNPTSANHHNKDAADAETRKERPTRVTRSQNKLMADAESLRLECLDQLGLYAFPTKGDGTLGFLEHVLLGLGAGCSPPRLLLPTTRWRMPRDSERLTRCR